MSKIIVRFSKKTSSPSINDAIKIAEVNEHYEEDGFYFVHFKDITGDLKRLLDIVSRWKASKLFLDGKEVSFREFKDVYFCDYKLICTGICNHIWLGHKSLQELQNILENKEKYVGAFTISSLSDFLKKENDTTFTFDKNKIIDYIKDNYSFEIDYCDKIKTEEIFNIIEKLPEKIQIYQNEDEIIDAERNQETYEEILEFETRKKAEIFADVFEKKIRKIIREELGGKK